MLHVQTNTVIFGKGDCVYYKSDLAKNDTYRSNMTIFLYYKSIIPPRILQEMFTVHYGCLELGDNMRYVPIYVRT